jgi:preprotein translocase subunit SecG
MIYLFLVLIIIASVAMGLFILIQNPKGGGLAGTIGGINSQFMGVKQTTDVLEKGTWVMATAIGLLCLFSAFFIPTGKASNREPLNAKPAVEQTAPAQQPSGSPLQPQPQPANP